MKAPESAGVLELDMYNHLLRSSLARCQRMRRDCTRCNGRIRSTATTDAGSGSSHRCQVMSGSSTTLRIPTMTYAEIHELRVRYWMAGRMHYEFGSGDTEELRSETRERRKWVNRVSELRTGGSNQLGVPFFCFFSSHLHTLLLLWISARYKWRRHGFYHLRISVNGRWSFPVRRIRRKGHNTVPIGSGTFELVRVRTRHDCLMLSFHFHFSCTAYAAQEVCA
jgi:hypothetical protein